MTRLDPRRFNLRFFADRRGVSSLVFAGSAVILFGAVAIAADGGSWLAARRGASNAADAGAAAGVMALSLSGRDAGRAAALDISGRNGFAHGGATSVAVNIPPVTGAHTANPTAVEVIVSQTQALGAAGFFLSTPPTVSARSVAVLRESRDVCILALEGQLWAGGSTSVRMPNCVLASNRRASPSIEIDGGSLELRAYSLSAVAGCQNCGSGNVTLTERFGEWQAPTADPFVRLQSKVLPTRAANGCVNSVNSPVQPFEANGNRLICAEVKVNGGQTLELLPGTHYLHNSTIDVQGGGTLSCPTCTGGQGVAIVLTGDVGQIGGIKFNGNSTVNLRAARDARDPDFKGILFYRDVRGDLGVLNNPRIDLSGGSTMALEGGMYFPSTFVRMTGNSSAVTCSVLVAHSITFTGNSDITGCADPGTTTTVPRTRTVAVAE